MLTLLFICLAPLSLTQAFFFGSSTVRQTTRSSSCYTTDGQQCIFPFTYKGKTYEGCTRDPGHSGRRGDYSWCATSVDSYGVAQRGSYSSCSSSCPTDYNSRTVYQPPKTKTGSTVCSCINPFAGTRDSHRGDIDITCNKRHQAYCYVDCNSDCRDKRNAKGKGRCWSEIACDKNVAAYVPEYY